MKKIWIAAGCFWGVAEFYRRVKGVAGTRVGYANGPGNSVSYDEVCDGSGHAETAELVYDPKVISLVDLIELMFLIVDPYSLNKQGNDVGVQYRSGIYYETPTDGAIVKDLVAKKQTESTKKIRIEVLPLRNFVPAEQYHQDYLIKNPRGYCHVDFGALPDDFKKTQF